MQRRLFPHVPQLPPDSPANCPSICVVPSVSQSHCQLREHALLGVAQVFFWAEIACQGVHSRRRWLVKGRKGRLPPKNSQVQSCIGRFGPAICLPKYRELINRTTRPFWCLGSCLIWPLVWPVI